MHNIPRITRLMLVVGVVAGLVVAVSGCTGRAATGSAQQGAEGTDPTVAVAPPTMRLVTPLDGAEIPAGSVELKVETTGLEFVMPGKNVPGQGHVHFTLDDQPFKMSTEPDYVLEGVSPGPHKLLAELVQNDTAPFEPRVKQEISFTAK